MLHLRSLHTPLPPIALLAGGQATRLYPQTRTIPKSLLEVAGRPFILHQLEQLKAQGAEHVVVCAGFLGEQIQAVVGDGRKSGLKVEFHFDGEKLLGTGGALRAALPLLGERFLVLYGDSYLSTDFRRVWNFFQQHARLGLMTLFRNHGRWDQSNVSFVQGKILRYDKQNPGEDLAHIDYGLNAFRREAFDQLPGREAFDLAELQQTLLAQGELLGFEVNERFYEIGSPAGLAETRAYLSRTRP